jgi:hypothetical protein
MPRPSTSRPARWTAAADAARKAIDEMQAAAAKIEDAFSELRDIQSEYQEWKDGLPENLSASPVGEKLDAVCDIDLEWDAADGTASDAEEKVNEAEGADLPRGFGKD